MELDPENYENIDVSEHDTHNIVLSYLVHNCFKETLESFIGYTGLKQPADCLEDIERRKRIIKSAIESNALKAIELTEELAPNLLEENKDLHFNLLCLHFVELVCSKKCTEALEFAQKKLTPFIKENKYVGKLEDFLSLLAYEEPEKSPLFYLVSLDYRQYVADNLNRAILAYAKKPSYPSLERLIQQNTVVRQHLNQEHAKIVGGNYPIEERATVVTDEPAFEEEEDEEETDEENAPFVEVTQRFMPQGREEENPWGLQILNSLGRMETVMEQIRDRMEAMNNSLTTFHTSLEARFDRMLTYQESMLDYFARTGGSLFHDPRIPPPGSSTRAPPMSQVETRGPFEEHRPSG